MSYHIFPNGSGFDIRNRLGKTVKPTEKTLDMALDSEAYA